MNGSEIKKAVLLIKAPKVIENSFEKFASFFTDLHKFVKDKKGLSKAEKTALVFKSRATN